ERPRDQADTRVAVDRAEVAEDGALILIRLVASHFLWKMVRRCVGALVKVGAGELAIEEFAALVDGERPHRGPPAEWPAPPSGLSLERVLYAGDPPLPPLRPAVPVGAEPEPGRSPRRR